MNTYSFEPYVAALDANWYEDDEVLRRLLAMYAGAQAAESESELRAFGAVSAGRFAQFAEESARPENAPRLVHFDAYHRRVDAIELPGSTQEALRLAHGQHRLGAAWGNPFVFYTKGYLFSQNGEAGVGCSLACTDGMVRVLEALGEAPLHREVVRRIRESTAERYTHGAQFVTEIQGGSDVPANELRAVPADAGEFRLHGSKWFCSNINADFFLVTGRPDGAPEGKRGVALFLVPAYRDDARRERNGYTIDRLKDKLGTRELATAEVTFQAAHAVPIGALDRGINNVLRHVLVTSRFACASSAASFLRRAERIALAYSDFRKAFGMRLADFPLVRQQLGEIRSARARSLAILFDLLKAWPASRTRGGEETEEGLDFRVMMSLAKPVLTAECTRLVHEP
jgi:alkylation response protein AidB-like acyl-CoA dehydrogenase